ncbi:GNAT family N-acetyltransferase [Actinopolymorpha pittospori]|uniref:Acetyltransferase n=1 Tax=Actinopolymorpha pittospori TaxID=648752 RepID=A0A927RKT3_9ACTN|nr:putative acetyltransferase [Actinopolymorpha pittospori]
MSDYVIRVVQPEEHRAAHTVFRVTLHVRPTTDGDWSEREPSYELGRTWGAFRDQEIVGSAQSWSSALAVPGGEVVPMALVSRVGVRADHTRRGVLCGLMGAQLGALTEPLATLRATEGAIYGRFGYGVASRYRQVRIRRARARFRPEVPTGRQIRLVSFDQAQELMPPIYNRVASSARPGWVQRPAHWWTNLRLRMDSYSSPVMVAVHTGQDGDDGYALYTVQRGDFSDPDAKTVLELRDLVTLSTEAWAGLWRYLLSVDLVTEVVAKGRPMDEPLEQLFTDRRALNTERINDETWLRIVDVPSALAARRFGLLGVDTTESLVLEVRDAILPENAGSYRIGAEQTDRVTEAADLVLDVDALGELYLGDVTPTALAQAGRLLVVNPNALSLADRLFAVNSAPWCGTDF